VQESDLVKRCRTVVANQNKLFYWDAIYWQAYRGILNRFTRDTRQGNSH
jgi:hypothetical protein